MPDDDSGPQRGDWDAGISEESLDVMAAAQVRGQVVIVASQTTEVDDPPETCVRSHRTERLCRFCIFFLEAGHVERMHEVVGGIATPRSRGERSGVSHVSLNRLARALVCLWIARHRTHPVPGLL